MSEEPMSVSERVDQLESVLKPVEPRDVQLAPSLTATARQLEMEMKKDTIRSSLEDRPSVEEMTLKGHISILYIYLLFVYPNVAPSLVSRARSIEKEMTKDSLHRELEKRSDSSDLEDRGIIRGSESSVLSSRKVELERNMNKDNLHRELDNRPGRDEMVERGLLNAHASNPMAAKVNQLDKEMKKDAVNRGLKDRSDMDSLVDHNIQKHTEVAPSLRSSAHSLERNMKKDNLNRSLMGRPEEKDLVESNKIIGHQVSAKLQSTERQLGMEIKKHDVDQSLYHRPSPEELKTLLPGVYESLTEEAKEYSQGKESTALFKVFASLILATGEQLMIVEKMTAEQYDELEAIMNGKDIQKRNTLLNAASNYKKFGKYEEYETTIMEVLH